MPSNRYDKPVEQEYVSQYTPIPFEQLYNLGKAYNERVDKALSDMQDFIKANKEFKSPSAKDTKKYYDLTIGGAANLINNLVSNPDLIRTPEGQLQIQNYINSRPYSQLSMLEQSRDNMLTRQKLEQELAKKNQLYGPWHNFDYTNYDTLGNEDTPGQGIFDQTNLVPFQSFNEMISPYVDNIKDSYLYSDGLYDYTGVSPETLQQVVSDNRAALMATPQAGEYIKQIMAAGATPEEAAAMFFDSLLGAAAERAHKTRDANPYALKMAKSGNDDEDDQNPLDMLTTNLQISGFGSLNGLITDLISNDKTLQAYQKELDDTNTPDSRKDILRKSIESRKSQYYDPKYITKVISEDLISRRKSGEDVDTSADGVFNEFINRAGSPVRGQYGDLLLNTVPGISTNDQYTEIGKYRTLNSGKTLKTVRSFAKDVLGLSTVDNSTDDAANKFQKALSSNKFHNIVVLGNEDVVTLPKEDKAGNITGLQSYQTLQVAIPKSQLDKNGFDENTISLLGGELLTSDGIVNVTENMRITQRDDVTTGSRSKTQTSKGTVDYYVFRVVSEIPTTGLGAEYLDQSAMRLNLNPSNYSKQYGSVQQQAYPD